VNKGTVQLIVSPTWAILLGIATLFRVHFSMVTVKLLRILSLFGQLDPQALIVEGLLTPISE